MSFGLFFYGSLFFSSKLSLLEARRFKISAEYGDESFTFVEGEIGSSTFSPLKIIIDSSIANAELFTDLGLFSE